jgi:hypothetical protein
MAQCRHLRDEGQRRPQALLGVGKVCAAQAMQDAASFGTFPQLSSAALSGTGSGALLTWDPPSIDFGGLQVGNVERRDATVLSTGNTPLTVTAVSISGDFAHGQGCQFPVAPGSYCRIRVVFRPTAAGPQTRELVVASDALGSPHRLSLSGVGLVPGIDLSAAEIDVGSQTAGTVGPAQHLVIASTGTAPLSIAEVAVSGAHPGDFRIQDACGWRGHMPGTTCNIEVAFAPRSPGQRTAELVIRDNAPGGPHTVSLTGISV